jgi:two-component system NarL family response regulator
MGNNMNPIRILLVDDHFVVRVGLSYSLQLEPNFRVVAEAGTGAVVQDLYREYQPDVVIMDWKLPSENADKIIRRLRTEFRDARVIVLSAFETEEIIYQAVQAGAVGFLPKSAPRPELIQAILTVSRGEPSFSHEIAVKVTDRLRRPDLTAREIQVVEQLVKGSSNKIIASELSISDNTVKLHITRIMQKLGAKDRTHAASLALQRGILDI